MLASAAVLVGVLIWAIGVPGAGVVRDVVTGAAGDPDAAWQAAVVPGAVVVRTLGHAALIGLLATALAWGPARVIAGPRGRRWAPVLATPMLLPMYLAPSAWGQWRDPGTPIGDAIARMSGGDPPIHGLSRIMELAWRAEVGELRWVPVVTSKSIALVGLSLWAVPIAACVLAAGFARQDRSLDDARRLEGGRLVRRASLALGAHRWSVGAAVGAVALIMVGSAVPMHLAQMDTVAILAWRQLAESGPDAWWRAWVAAWPTLMVAAVAGWVIGGHAVRAAVRVRESGAPEATRSTPARGWAMIAGVVFCLAVALPLAQFWHASGGWGAIEAFFTIEGGALGSSAIVAGLVGLVVAGLALVTAALLSGVRHRWIVSTAARAALIAGLVPGVLIGAAVARSPIDGLAGLIAAHAARFAFIGIGLGCWAAAGEPPERRALRRLDGQETLGAWARACLPTQWGVILGAGVAAAALSLHEIEASVIVQPPGVESLSRDVLQMLHYARTRELAAAGAVIVSLGLVLAVLGGVGIASGRGRRIS